MNLLCLVLYDTSLKRDEDNSHVNAFWAFYISLQCNLFEYIIICNIKIQKNDILFTTLHRLVDPFTSTTLTWTWGPPGAEKQREKRIIFNISYHFSRPCTHLEYYVSLKCLANLYTCLTIRS